MMAMVLGRITSMLEKQEGTASAMFNFIVTSKPALQHLQYMIEPSSKEENPMTRAIICHMKFKNKSGVRLHQIIEF